MITAYHRPDSIEAALALISRDTPRTVPLGGGTLLSQGSAEPLEVVDLQALNLAHVRINGKDLEIGATTTLERLRQAPECPEALKIAIRLEAPLNIRNAATVAGALATCDGRSPFGTGLLALDAQLSMMNPLPRTIGLGDLLPVRQQVLPRTLIVDIRLPAKARFAFEYVARTPMDTPIVGVALALWPSGRTRLAIGGYGLSPLLAVDGTDSNGLEAAARNALHDANDPWGSAAYRMDVGAILARRCLESLAN